MDKAKRIAELRALIAGHEISEANGARPQLDGDGNTKVDTCTCGTCGLSWNDALITGRTPAPSGRCPYEYIHSEIAELNRLTQAQRPTGIVLAAFTTPNSIAEIGAALDRLETPLPPDPEGMNDDRADWADTALRAFARETHMDGAGEDDATIFGDLMADLMHWCDRHEIDFDSALEKARCNYAEETRDD